MSTWNPPNLRPKCWGQGTKVVHKLGYIDKCCRVDAGNSIWRNHCECPERVFQMVGAATAELREPKHVRTRGTTGSRLKSKSGWSNIFGLEYGTHTSLSKKNNKKIKYRFQNYQIIKIIKCVIKLPVTVYNIVQSNKFLCLHCNS